MQKLKESVLFALIAVFVASFAVAPASAQSNGVSADVPFDFSVGSQHFTAGNYHVDLAGSQHSFVAISQIGGKTAYSIYNSGGASADRNGQPYLVFVRYGTESFLTKIVYSSSESYTIPLSNREREIIAQAASFDQVDVPAGSR